MFQDREDAGIRLGKFLQEKDLDIDLVVGILRGGVPVAVNVAEILGVKLDAIAVSKVGAPQNPELAVGAVTADGPRYLNEELVKRLNVEGLEEKFEEEQKNAKSKMESFDEIDVDSLKVLLVDDGIATGSTAKACITALRSNGARKVFLAVPVGPEIELDDADKTFVLEPIMGAVSSGYKEFGQVSIEEVRSMLERF